MSDHVIVAKIFWGATAAALFSGILLLSSATAAPANDRYGLDTTARKADYVGPNERPESIYAIMTRLISGALALTAILFFGFTIYAGLRWMTARGQDELKEKAIHTLSASIIGLAIVVSAYAITNLILQGLGG